MAVTSFKKYGNKSVPKLLEKVDTLSIVNNTTDGGTNLPLSAEQGKLLNQAINTEAAARIQNIIDLKDGASASFNTLKKIQVAIESEVSARESAVGTVATMISASVTAEETRAKAAETALSEAISNGGTSSSVAVDALRVDMQNADEAINTALQSEITRATNKENALQSAIDAEVVARNTAVSEVSLNLANETQNRTNQDTAINNRIALLETAVASGIIWKQSFESTEAMGSSLSEQSVMGGWAYYISTQKDVYIVVDGVDGDFKPESWTTKSFVKIADFNEISQLVAGEKIRAVAAEAELQANIATEATTRQNADLALNQLLTQESSRAVSAEEALGLLISKEITDRVTAITAEATARDNADKAISADVLSKYNETKTLIEAEATRATTAENALNTKVDGILSNMDEREAAMDARMDAVEGDETTPGSIKKSLFDAKVYADSMALRRKIVGRDGFTIVAGDQFTLPFVPADGVDGAGEVVVYQDSEAISTQVANVVGTNVILRVSSSGEFDGCSVTCDIFYRNADQIGAGAGGAGSGGAGA